ncbi:hypothetical protein ACFL20_13730, partial [Spirochaetota bacterium]
LLMICFFSFNFFGTAFSDEEIKKEKVIEIIKMVETKLQLLISEKKSTLYAQDGIEKIKAIIASSKNLLKEEKTEQAYYEIVIAKAYFRVISSREKLFDAEKKYNKRKNEINK